MSAGGQGGIPWPVALGAVAGVGYVLFQVPVWVLGWVGVEWILTDLHAWAADQENWAKLLVYGGQIALGAVMIYAALIILPGLGLIGAGKAGAWFRGPFAGWAAREWKIYREYEWHYWQKFRSYWAFRRQYEDVRRAEADEARRRERERRAAEEARRRAAEEAKRREQERRERARREQARREWSRKARGGGAGRASGPPPPKTLEAAMQTLGLKDGFTRKDFNRARRAAILRTHPDRGGSTEDAQAVNVAVEVIRKRKGWV